MLSRLNVRTKLLVMLLPAVLGLCSLAGVGVKARLDDRSAAQLTRTASDVAAVASGLVHKLQMERVAAASMAAVPGPELDSIFADQRTATDLATEVLHDALTANADQLSHGPTRGDFASLQQGVGRIAAVRDVVAGRKSTQAYSDLIDSQLAAIGHLELVAGDGVGNTTSRRWLAAGIEAESDAAAVGARLLASDLSDVDRAAAATSARELANRAAMFYETFTEYAATTGADQFATARSSVGSRATDESFAELAGLDGARTFSADAPTWPGLVRARLSAVESVEAAGYGADIAKFAAAAEAADSAVVYFATGAAASCILVILLAFGISRHITTNLRRLTDAAHEISEEQVPALVHSLKAGTGLLGVHFTEVETGGSDELGEVGHALNELGRALVAVAGEQQMSLRKGISDIFVNLARRNQTLLDRQIQFIDRLEANEQDPDQLENLFRLDHLATRMRRNAESLLVLAGAEAPRRRARDVGLSDVIRVAVGEVEDFARISLIAVEDAEATGNVAVDIAHLLAELMENGAQYSPPERTVDVVGHRSLDGGYVISITDHGVGMSAERLDAANRLLASPPAVGLGLTRALGFVVAGTLASRHGIHVHLGPSPSGGVTAEVALPAALVQTVVPEAPSIPPANQPVLVAESSSGSTSPISVVDCGSGLDSAQYVDFSAAVAVTSGGWTADGEYVYAGELPPPHEPEVERYEPFMPWEPTESISWSEERLPVAPAPSKLVDMLPEGAAFDAGLYSLLGDERPPVAPAGELPPAPWNPVPPPGLPSELPEPLEDPVPPTMPPIPGLWAPPIIHPRRPSGGSPDPASSAPSAPLPAAPPPTASPAPLPQRSAGGSRQVTPTPAPADRSVAPQRPASEVRSVLSRYRSGLDHGRAAVGDTPAPDIAAGPDAGFAAGPDGGFDAPQTDSRWTPATMTDEDGATSR